MASFAHNLPDTTSEDELLNLVLELNADEEDLNLRIVFRLKSPADDPRVRCVTSIKACCLATSRL